MPSGVTRTMKDDEVRLLTHFVDLLDKMLNLEPLKRPLPKVGRVYCRSLSPLGKQADCVISDVIHHDRICSRIRSFEVDTFFFVRSTASVSFSLSPSRISMLYQNPSSSVPPHIANKSLVRREFQVAIIARPTPLSRRGSAFALTDTSVPNSLKFISRLRTRGSCVQYIVDSLVTSSLPPLDSRRSNSEW